MCSLLLFIIALNVYRMGVIMFFLIYDLSKYVISPYSVGRVVYLLHYYSTKNKRKYKYHSFINTKKKTSQRYCVAVGVLIHGICDHDNLVLNWFHVISSCSTEIQRFTNAKKAEEILFIIFIAGDTCK